MSLKLALADGLPFSTPHRELETNTFRAPAYKRADIGMSYRLLDNSKGTKKSIFKNIWLGVDCLNLHLSVRRYRAIAAVLPKEDAVLRRRQRFVGRLGQKIALRVTQRVSKPGVRLNALGVALAVD